MDSSSCWIFSKMNTCQSGEKQVMGILFTPLSGDLIICDTLTLRVWAGVRLVSVLVLVCVGLKPQCITQRRNSSECLNSLVKLLFLGRYSDPTLFVTPVDETSFEAGIKVQIHSQDEPSFIDQLGFGVAPGFQTFVSCQEQRVQTFCMRCLSKHNYDLKLGLIFVPLSINFSPTWQEMCCH